MDRHHTTKERAEVLERFLQKLTDSGYNAKARREIVLSGLKRYRRLLHNEATGGPRLYRSAKEMAGKCEIKAILGQSWFKVRRGGTKDQERKD